MRWAISSRPTSMAVPVETAPSKVCAGVARWYSLAALAYGLAGRSWVIRAKTSQNLDLVKMPFTFICLVNAPKDQIAPGFKDIETKVTNSIEIPIHIAKCISKF